MAWLQTQVCHTLLCPEAFLHYQSSIIMIMTRILILILIDIINHHLSIINRQASILTRQSAIVKHQSSEIHHQSSISTNHRGSSSIIINLWSMVNHQWLTLSYFIINHPSSSSTPWLFFVHKKPAYIASQILIWSWESLVHCSHEVCVTTSRAKWHTNKQQMPHDIAWH